MIYELWIVFCKADLDNTSTHPFSVLLMLKFNFFRAVIPQRDRMRYCFDIQICFLIVKKIDKCKNVSFEYDMSITESPTWDKFVKK